MQTIKVGDLYFLESPFHFKPDNADTAEQAKRFCYLVGTVSSRPAIVVRAPAPWDKYSTVTVIPAVTGGSPSIKFDLIDRYGKPAGVYSFLPHNPYTIHVSRLGKYIGSLTEAELDQLMYSFNWIHNEYSQSFRESHQVPDIYKTDICEDKVAIKLPTINIDANTKEVTSSTNPELNGFNVSSIYNNPNVDSEAGVFIPVEDSEAQISTSTENVMVPVERSFPASMFGYDVLCNVASRFTISDAYYQDSYIKKSWKCLNAKEIAGIIGTNKPKDFSTAVKVYEKMTVMDAYLLGPRLPLQVLAEITELPTEAAAVLKRICNKLRDMDDGLYKDRAQLSTIKPYLNAKNHQLLLTNQAAVAVFISTPKYELKKLWKGPQFEKYYDSIMSQIKKKEKEQ